MKKYIYIRLHIAEDTLKKQVLKLHYKVPQFLCIDLLIYLIARGTTFCDLISVSHIPPKDADFLFQSALAKARVRIRHKKHCV